MPNSSPKFATKHKFSGPKKKRKFFNFQKRRGSPSEVIDDSLLPEPSATEDSAEDCGIGLAGGSGSDSGRVRQTFRHDTVMLEPADLLKIEKDAEEKLRNLASTPATKRKSELLVRAADAAAASDAAAEGSDVMNTRFAVVSLDAINALLSFFKCKVCGGDASMSKGNEAASSAILKELKINPGLLVTKRMAEKDHRRATASASKRVSAESMQRALKKRHLGDSNQKDYMPGAY
ncbi:hypothetical protein HPB49_018765 [Dermacentor silvarum]|uniref:Uncharacterized protein n=1 Tax=Dermacentor silvarum TaxID=543639 RepID=A0ACB8CZ84_DERSI|nr:hypothetical protein HPB49_018765 [Dermacentor silvarum]